MRRKHLRIIVCLLLTALALPLPPGGAEAVEVLPVGQAAASGFADTEGHWAWAYIELVRHYGDVPYGLENAVVDEGYTLTSRFDILDNCIAKLKG